AQARRRLVVSELGVSQIRFGWTKLYRRRSCPPKEACAVQVPSPRLRLKDDEGSGPMNIQTITLIAALTGVAAHAGEKAGAPPVRHVTVCVQNAVDGATMQARGLASNVFAAIGVNIDWRQGFSRCPQQSIMISCNPARWLMHSPMTARIFVCSMT